VVAAGGGGGAGGDGRAGWGGAGGGQAETAGAGVQSLLPRLRAGHHRADGVQAFTLANSGGQATGRLKVMVAGAAGFSITGDRCSGRSLGPGKSCTVSVRFAPTSLGTVTATLTAAGKKPAATATVALTGTGVAVTSTHV
jgi:hypothetical protein